jgi:hypothetical protein
MADPARTSPGQQLIPVVLPLQTAYGVNMGGPAVAAAGDTLWRGWTNDQSFLAASVGVVTRVRQEAAGGDRRPRGDPDQGRHQTVSLAGAVDVVGG